MKKKGTFRIIVGALLTGVLVFFAARALHGMDPSVLLRSQINWWIFVLAVLLFGVGQAVRAFVYPYGIDPELTLFASFRIVLIGNMVNLLLPLRAGEGVRFAFFPGDYSASKRTWRILLPGGADVVIVLLLSLLALPLAKYLHPQAVQILRTVATALCIAAAVLLLAFLLAPFVNRRLHALCTPGFWHMAGWIVISWATMLFSMWLALLALSFAPWQAMRMAIALFATTNLISFIPSSPGGIGLYEYAVVLALSFFGVAQGPALAAAFLLHLVQYVALLPMGTCAWLSGLAAARHTVAVHKAL